MARIALDGNASAKPLNGASDGIHPDAASRQAGNLTRRGKSG
jgi:hypothetical protein